MREGYIFILLICILLSCKEKKSSTEKKFAPSDWFYAQRAFPNLGIDYNAYQSAARSIKKNITTRSSQEGYNDPWQAVTPRNINGRITDIEMPADNVNIIYAGTASGGIFKSRDKGNSWVPIFDDALSLSIGDIALAPSDNDIIYVGTGEANAGGGSLAYDGVGVYKSNDAGQSWEHIGLSDVGSIGKVVVNPNDPDEVYVAAMGRLFGNNTERGVYKTIDGGDTWSQVLFISENTGAIDLAINPKDPREVYAAMWQRERKLYDRTYGGENSGIYKSTDAGATWHELTEGIPRNATQKGRIGIAIAPTNPEVLYAIYAKTNGSLQGMYKTINGGDQWSSLDDRAISDVPFMWWFGKVFVNPTDEDMAYATSLDMFRTRDGGASWFPIFEGAHVDHHALFVHPLNPDLVVNGNDGGIYISEDGGRNYQFKNYLPNLQFYTCHIDNTNPERIFGGTQDNGTLMMADENSDWELIFGGDGFRVLSDPNNPNIIFVEFQNGNISRSNDGGNSFTSIKRGTSGKTNWNTPYILDPNNSDVIYYGTDRVFKSNDQGDNWSTISSVIPITQESGINTFGTITAISVSPINNDYLYAGTDDGEVSFINQKENIETSINAELPRRWVTSIAADPHDAATVYITLSGFRYDEVGAHVFKSDNLGETWTDISTTLPDIPVNDIIVDPMEAGLLYIATDVGVYISFNDGDNWEVLGENLPLVPVTDIDLHAPSRKLAAATYGRSIFTYSLPLSTSTHDNFIEKNITVYPNPSSNYLTIFGINDKKLISIYNLEGKKILARTHDPKERINVSELNPGVYILKIGETTLRFIKT